MARPPIIETPEEFTQRAEDYFALCASKEQRPTVNGLCLALGFSSRQSLHNYAQRPEFMDAVKAAQLRLEAEWEQGLAGNSVAGTIFWLKNHGWTDRTEQMVQQTVQHSGKVELDPSEAYQRLLNG